jgi:hypothetical protein
MYIGIWCSPSFIDQELFNEVLLEYNKNIHLATISAPRGMLESFIMTFAWSYSRTWECVEPSIFETCCSKYIFFMNEGDCVDEKETPKCNLDIECITYYSNYK